jgi:hypothetical protein
VDANARALLVPVPVVADGAALEESDEDVAEAAGAGEEGGRVDDPPVKAADGDAEQEPGDGELDEEHGAAVGRVAHEPPLRCRRIALFREIGFVLARAIDGACAGEDGVCNKDDLRLSC